jgi:hypothetical protein
MDLSLRFRIIFFEMDAINNPDGVPMLGMYLLIVKTSLLTLSKYLLFSVGSLILRDYFFPVKCRKGRMVSR